MIVTHMGPISSLCAAIALTLGIVGTAAAQSDTHLQVGVTGLTTHLDPMGFNANVNMRVSQNVVETLIRYDFRNGTFGPGLATDWTMVSPTVMELTLRQGVTCHNGEDFTAEDVAVMFGPERYQGEDAPGHKVAKQFLNVIKAVSAVDGHTVRIETSSPDPLLETRLANWMSEVPCADAYRAAGSWEKWGQGVVGTGPYKVAEVRPGEFQRFERFDGYWGEQAPVASFTLKVIPETGARIAALLAGDLDIIAEISPDQFEILAKNAGTEVVGGPIRNIRTIAYDTRHPVLANPKVRQAMNLAIDRQLIVESIFKGRTDVPSGFQMKSFGKMFIEGFAGATYDPEKARRLLEEAGYGGEEISFRYMTDYYTGEVTTTQILQQMWQDVGLKVKLDLKENWDQILNNEFNEGRGVINDSSNAVYPDPIGQINRQYGPTGYYQRKGYWGNPDFDKAGAKLLSLDINERRKAFEQMLTLYETDPPGTYLYVLPMFYGKRTAVDWGPIDTPFMDFRAGNLNTSQN